VDLGYYGAVRFRVAPLVELEPDTTPITIDSVRINAFTLTGTVRNLKETVGCKLEWKVSTSVSESERATERTVAHPRPTVLVPSGATYEIKEQGANGPVPLVVDAFELDLIGTGRLGYTLELQMIGQAPKSVASKTSGIEVNLPVTVTTWMPSAPALPTVPSGRESNTSDSEVAADDVVALAARAFADGSPPPQNQGAKEPVVVGGLVSFDVVPCQGFVGHPLRLDIAEFVDDSHEMEGTRTSFLWTPSGMGKETFKWRIGMLSRGEAHILAPSTVEAGSRAFRWTVTAFRSAPPPGAAGEAPGSVTETDVVTSSSVEFCTAEHPRLAQLSLSERAASTTDGSLSELVVSATFENLDHSLEFDMDLELMVKSEKVNQGFVQLSKLLSDLGRNDDLKLKTSARVKMAALNQAAILISGCRETLRAFDPELGLFAAISFGSAAVSTQGNCVFNSVASYTPNLESAPNAAGFAPFRAGWLTRPEVGIAVCTKLRKLDGEPVDLAGSTSVPQPLWSEYRVFLAIVVGEAGGTSEVSWRGVAHTMLNRKNAPFPDWATFTSIEKVASAKSQFNAYEGANFRAAMAYFERKYVKKDVVDRTADERKYARMEDVLIPVFMAGVGERPETGVGPHNGWGVNYFFSPKLLAQEHKSPPTWAKDYEDVTGRFSPPGGGVNPDFRFFRRRPGQS